jgi:hypothetical protein
VSLMTKQASQANGMSAEAAQERARQAAQYLRARQLAAQAQLAPLAANARTATQQGIYGARVWAAPRLYWMGQAMQERWAPWMSARLSAYARRIEPTPARPPWRRWPLLAAGLAGVAGGTVAAVVIVKRMNHRPAAETAEPGGSTGSSATPREMATADAAGADLDGQTQAP